MTNQQGAPEAPKGTASDGKTELFNVPGYPLMVRAVDFNRLHAENEHLAALVEAQQLTAHVQNTAKIEHVAGDVSKNGPESNMAQQPAPSAAVASKAVLAAIRAANLQLVRTGDDEFMLVTLKQATPQADSQPVVGREAVIRTAVAALMDAEANSQSAHQRDTGYPPLPECDATTVGLGAVWNRHSMRAYVDADRTARAQADSVTAPAGWKLVPEEPTDEMLNATYAGQHCSDVYRDMLAAAPKALDVGSLVTRESAIQAIEHVALSHSMGLEAIDMLAAAVAATDEADTVDLVGVRATGEHVNLGKIAMPPRMKAREIARSYFGHFEDEDGSDAELCFGALETLLDWLSKQGWEPNLKPIQGVHPAVSKTLVNQLLEALEISRVLKADYDSLENYGVASRKHAKAIADARAYVATPPAQAADSQPAHQWDTGYPPLPECDATTVGLGAVWNRHSMRAYVDADRTARAQADSVTAPAGGANWQDISTAPKDGTRFVAVGNNYGLYSEPQHTCIAQWFRGCWMDVSEWNETSELKYLTHWMPLLPLPGTAARKQGGA